MEAKSIYVPKSKIEKDTMTVYGAGIFHESSLVLDKTRALFLMIELYQFLQDPVTKQVTI